MGVVAPCRGTIRSLIYNIEVTKNRVHVPATASEALSAHRRRCRDMEALFCDFHGGGDRVGVTGSGGGGWLGCAGTGWIGGLWVARRVVARGPEDTEAL
jgi:hypothetical protein